MPGIIDIHTNGGFGVDFASLGVNQLEEVSRHLVEHGCTAFLPTLISAQPPLLKQSLEALSSALDEGSFLANPLGIHLEGPFLNPERAGAHPQDVLLEPDCGLFQELWDVSRQKIRILTLAPELKGAFSLIEEFGGRCLMAAGHSEASYQVMMEAIDRGLRSATHVFNTMSPLHHREPGLLGAILTREEVYAEIIADGWHVHPAMIDLLFRCKGASRIISVTDAVSAAGMPDGRYPLGDSTITLRQGVCRNPAGALAGSSLLPDQGLRNLYRFLTGSRDRLSLLAQIVRMVSSSPAQLLGLSGMGRIEPGCVADLVLLENDLKVRKTWIRGKLVFDAESG